MAKIQEADARWIVKEREDGRNCNNWHWTTKDVSAHVKSSLASALQEIVFAAPLSGCSVKSAEVTGDASINNRKGRTFLIYELAVKLKWEGELRDGEGKLLEASKGSMKFPDVCATYLDDLDVEFTCKDNNSSMVKAMRGQGVAQLKKLIETTVLDLQEQVRANQVATAKAPAAAAPAATPRPLPQPIKIEKNSSMPAAGTPAAAPAAATATAKDSDDEGDAEEEPPPPPLAAALTRLRSRPAEAKVVRLSNCMIKDVHVRALVEALQHSENATEELDLAFNRLTDAGVHVLLKAIATGCAMELTRLNLGGNKTSVNIMAFSQNLKQMRSDLLVDWKPQLRNAQSMSVVGNVYNGSPAAKAGLQTGDSIVAFGALQYADFKSVTESIVPAVKANVGKAIDVIVVRMVEGAQVRQIALSLTPQTWSGGGLLGCILK